MRRFRTVSDALEKMNAGYRREALQLVHGENQRTVHHPVNHQTMLLGIDVRNVKAAVGSHIMERGRRNNPYRLRKRSHYMKRKPKGIGRRSPFGWLAYRGHKTGALHPLASARSRTVLLPRLNRPPRRHLLGIPFD